MEFIFYIGLLKEKFRRNTLTLEYKSTERMHEFSMRLKIKIEKGDEDRMAALVAAAQEASAAQTVAAADPLASYAEVAPAGKPSHL